MALKNRINYVFITLLAIFSFSTVMANTPEAGHEEGKKEEKFNVGEMIMHHIKDAHEWHLWGGHHNSTSIYLPVILIDGGLKTFSSSHFYHGTPASSIDHKTQKPVDYMVGVGPAADYAMFHEKIYKLEGGKLQFEGGHPHNVKPLDFSITKNVLSLVFGATLILIVMSSVARFYKKNGAVAPRGLAKFIEPLILMVRDDVAKSNIDKHKYHKYVPYLLTIFFFIFFNNLLGLVPIIPGGANLTGNITVTFFLAVCTLLVTVFSGNKNYWGHIFATPGVPLALLPIMIPIEVVGILTKPFALMVRLFANITAGHIIVLSLVSLIFIFENAALGLAVVPFSLFMNVIELIVAFIQAFIFTMLVSTYIGAAVEEHHH